MTTENLRREARVEVRVPVVIYRGRVAVTHETSDVSFKGLFVCTGDPPPLRSLVRLRLGLFDREFQAHAMVVHVVTVSESEDGRISGVGLQFWGLSGSDRMAWDEFVGGLVHQRRAAAAASRSAHLAAQAAEIAPQIAEMHPAIDEPTTPSGVRVVEAARRRFFSR